MLSNSMRIALILFLPLTLAGLADAQSVRSAANTPVATRPVAADTVVASPMAVADLDGDGRADVVFLDIDDDRLTDVLLLSNSRTRHDTVKNSINNVRRAAAPEQDIGDIDGDGAAELVILGASQAARSITDSRRSLLSIVRRELSSGEVLGVDALIAQGWLAPGAAGGNPLAHVIPTCPSGPVPVPVPLPGADPENPSSGGTAVGGGGSTVGGGIPISTGNDAGVDRGLIPVNPG